MQEEAGHSAEVQMRLTVNGSTFPISHMGPDFVRLRESVEQPPCNGNISLVIDGHESVWSVHLPQGVQSGASRIAVERIR